MSLFQISRPEPGQALVIHAVASDKITLGFSTEGVTLSRDDNALIFTFDDGAVIRLDDFYAEYRADSIPEFEVEGRLMSGTEFFTTFGPDLMPGAGPEHAVRNAHAVQADGDSSLMGGLDHLNGLDASAQEKSSAADGGIQFDSALAAGHGPADHGSGSADPELPPPAEQGFVRAVLYSPGDPGDSVSTPVFFGGNGVDPKAITLNGYNESGRYALYTVTVSMPEGWSDSWVAVNVDNYSDRLQFSLTPDGAAELQRLGLTDKNLAGLVHVKVTEQASGGTFEYDVELVATSNQNFDSIEYDRQGVGHHLESIGEFHQGQHNGGVYSIISSSRNDEIILNDNVGGGSSIYASGSVDRAHMADDNNIINLNAGVVNTTPGASTHVISANGELWVGGSVAVQGSGAENVIAMGRGSVDVYNKFSGDGVSAAHNGKNDISGGTVDITSLSGKGLAASNGGANDIATGGHVIVRGTTSGSDSKVYGYGISASSSGTNSINADSGNVTVTGTGSGSGSRYVYGYGISASSSGTNSITTESGDVTLTGEGLDSNRGYSYGYGMIAEDASSNTIATDSGSVTVTGSNSGYNSWGVGGGMRAASSGSTTTGSSNTITTNSGSVTVTGTSIGSGFTYGMNAVSFGSNSITTKSGDVTVATNGSGYGYFAGGTGLSADEHSSNTITTDSGSVTINGTGVTLSDGLVATSSSSNTITTGSGAVTVSGIGIRGGSGTGILAGVGGSNSITTDSGNVTVSGTGAAFGRGMFATDGHSTVTTTSGEVKVSGSGADSGYGMFAEDQGVNTIESTAGSPLTVTITASADTAEKAIAMWAGGKYGGGVNRITGHSQANGTDSVTLTANDGQGIAMLTDNGGKNTITTGAGDDSVTINGKVVGPGNEIDLGGGKDTLTLNGAVEAGSLKVSSEGGTYTLVLQAPDAESFVARYGDWITAIGADPLIADGLRGISFVGLNLADLPADFMTTFGELLDKIHTTAGAEAIVPPELLGMLTGHDSDSGFAASFAQTDAEHQTQDAQHDAAGHDASTQDAQHAATGYDASTQDVQHAAAGHTDSTQEVQHAAAGHDASTQETPPATHEGSVHMAGDDSQVAAAAASVQPDTAALHADILVPDDIAQPDFAVGQHAVETAQPLFAFLNAPGADAHVDTSAYEGDAPLHNGHLGSGESGSGNAGVQGEIALTLGDESLDSLLAGTDLHQAENGDHGLWYVESGSDLHEVPLTDMSEIIVQGGSGEHVSDAGVTTEEYAHLEQEVVSAPTVMDSNQEATDNAVREMANY
ncbi:MAG: hypothetical protein RBR41_11675 [Desulfovibrio sp.]|uniref:beta strand repeat-containing protein n=1 Tax=Desulfovibrio sp. TaxID=885 RepID=UPI002A36FC89|nr:hypothetical protein [Desulfovibrio sp.]MDY0260308.1 hypothetical protein [Desulfovibrio sp.]